MSVAPEVCLVNEALVRRYFFGEDPLGKRIMGHDEKGWKSIVGVVGNARNAGLRQEPQPEVFQSYQVTDSQATKTEMDLLVRSRMSPQVLIPTVRTVVRALDPNIPLTFQTMTDNLAELTAQPRFSALLLGIFAGIALTLAAVGTYAVLSVSVTQRTQEIGIRVALGATGPAVMRLVVGNALRLAFAGIVIGLLLAFSITRYLSSLLFEVQPTDPPTFVSVCVFLIAIALLASWIPGRRATRVDPVLALRAE